MQLCSEGNTLFSKVDLFTLKKSYFFFFLISNPGALKNWPLLEIIFAVYRFLSY